MSFRTEFTPVTFPQNIHFSDKIMLIGSCFSDNMGNFLNTHKFQSLSNHLGITYNPVSIHKLLTLYGWSKKQIATDELNQLQGVYSHPDFHSENNTLSPEAYIEGLNQKLSAHQQFLQSMNWLIITLGTSWIYESKHTGLVVNNCHKFPSHHFEKKLLSVEEITMSLLDIKDKGRQHIPGLKIIITISPVRHIKEGIAENSRSKAILLEAAHRMIEKSENVYYFPSYEIMMDDLRDYRFYSEDLIHPNKTATEYIWEKFVNTMFDKTSQLFVKEIKNINKAYRHKPFHARNPNYISFCRTQVDLIQDFVKRYGSVSFEEELEYYRSIIQS